eukprot:1161469-Pelagomonas_calceolata.AAC.9
MHRCSTVSDVAFNLPRTFCPQPHSGRLQGHPTTTHHAVEKGKAILLLLSYLLQRRGRRQGHPATTHLLPTTTQWKKARPSMRFLKGASARQPSKKEGSGQPFTISKLPPRPTALHDSAAEQQRLCMSGSRDAKCKTKNNHS